MNIPGKRGRTVPVILTTDIIAAMDLLCSQEIREKAGVAKDNIFAFPMIRGSTNNIRGCDAMNDMVSMADLKKPQAFKSTGLRKYIATVSQVLNMDENEMDWLASHLGHDIRVHRNFYRLQTEHVELAKVAKLLHAVDSGQAHSFAGKRLNDIQVEDFDDDENIYDDEDEECEEVPSNEEENLEYVEENQQHIDVIESNELQERSSGSKSKKSSAQSKRKEKDDTVKKGKQCIHKPWNKEEKEFVMKEFHRFIIKGQIAGVGKRRIDEAIVKSGGILKNRTWVQVKSCLKNIIVKIQKEKSRTEMRKK